MIAGRKRKRVPEEDRAFSARPGLRIASNDASSLSLSDVPAATESGSVMFECYWGRESKRWMTVKGAGSGVRWNGSKVN